MNEFLNIRETPLPLLYPSAASASVTGPGLCTCAEYNLFRFTVYTPVQGDEFRNAFPHDVWPLRVADDTQFVCVIGDGITFSFQPFLKREVFHVGRHV